MPILRKEYRHHNPSLSFSTGIGIRPIPPCAIVSALELCQNAIRFPGPRFRLRIVRAVSRGDAQALPATLCGSCRIASIAPLCKFAQCKTPHKPTLCNLTRVVLVCVAFCIFWRRLPVPAGEFYKYEHNSGRQAPCQGGRFSFPELAALTEDLFPYRYVGVAYQRTRTQDDLCTRHNETPACLCRSTNIVRRSEIIKAPMHKSGGELSISNHYARRSFATRSLHIRSLYVPSFRKTRYE